MTARSLARPVVRGYVRARTRAWPRHSRLFAVGEGTRWSVDEDARHLEDTARRLGYEVAPSDWARFAGNQAVFLTSHFEALRPRWLESTNRLATAYLHGRPGTPGYPEFDRAYETLRRQPGRLDRVQVTHAEMRDLVVSAGVDPERVHLIPIGIDLASFPMATQEDRASARAELGLPADAFVVGSFQKDGVGWTDGTEPKLVKGPDVLVAVLEAVAHEAPELHVVLTGPARGYVRGELERLEISYRHVIAKSRDELSRAYRALDVYVVTSRQEGGPKAMLESMASGIPFVTTRVGQAGELVRQDTNGFLSEVDDVEALVAAVLRVRAAPAGVSRLVAAGRDTAERYAYERLDHLWGRFLDGFLESRR